MNSAMATEYAFGDSSDFTGEAFFESAQSNKVETVSHSNNTGSTPPLKLLRLKIKEKAQARNKIRYELAPTSDAPYAGEVGTSEYASKELVDDFDEITSPDGFESDETSIEEHKKGLFHKKSKTVSNNTDTEDIILDCDSVDYDTPNYLILAKGNVNVEFVKQGARIQSDIMTFDRMNNTIKAEGNVKILKNGQTITGDYIFVDMNEENALIENPLTNTSTIEIKAKRGYVYGDKIVQENGSITVSDSYPMQFASATRGPQINKMLTPKSETLSDDMEKGLIKVEAKNIKITQKGDLETVAVKKLKIRKGEKTIFKVPAIKVYSNKNHDYVETNIWEIGSYRGLGVYTGPGWVFELPKGSVLKAIPMLNYKSGIGVGGLARFSSGTNLTTAGYGTAGSKFVILGKQRLDDRLTLQYGMNAYMDEWFLGRRRPKYGADLVYKNGYSSDNFLLKGHASSFSHRVDVGYYNDLDYDTNFEKLHGGDVGTTRFRYMAQGEQNLLNFEDKEGMKSFRFGVVGQLSSAIYGTGDTQVIARIAPTLHTQYKRWMQDIGYYFSVYDDNTPMPVFDAYRYGKQNLYLREYLRICRYLTVSWFGSINLSNDSPNGKDFQENSFYISVGPDDFKFNVGYDFVRENLYCTVEMMMDAKGTNVDYETLEIKQDKKAKNTETKSNDYEAPSSQPKVLQRAVVEDVKVMEDVI
jgi:hypothetical protein